MSAAATVFFLFVMIAGQGDGAALTTLGQFSTQQACATAAAAVVEAVKTGETAAHFFCVSSDDMAGIGKASHAGQ